MPRCFLGLVIAVAAVLVAPAAAAQAATPGYVTGTVTSASTGAAIAGVSVRTANHGASGPSAVTDAAGHYQIEFADLTEAAKYKVCFDTETTFTGPHDPGYVGECYRDVPWRTQPWPFPSGTTDVAVVPGETTARINGTLDPAGAISGRVLLSNGDGPVTGGSLTFYDSTGDRVYDSGAPLDAQGRFMERRLPAGAYYACLGMTYTSAPGGVFGACYPDVRFTYPDVPPRAHLIAVAAGATTTGIVIRATAAVAISGTVTAAEGGAPVSGVQVKAYGAHEVQSVDAYTGPDGIYRLIGLEPSAAGYRVCFSTQRDGRGAPRFYGKYPFGLVPQCADGLTWNPGGPPPDGARSVPASSGDLTTGVDAALATGGSIAGRVTDGGTGGNVFNVRVVAFTDAGQFVEQVSTSGSGTYALRGLATSSTGYRVCFDASGARTPTRSDLLLQSQCYQARPWRPVDVGPSPAARRVPVVQGAAHQGVNAVLEPGGGIAGQVLGPALPLPYGVLVRAFDASGLLVASTISNVDYRLNGLPPSTAGYRICFDPSTSARPDLLPECYKNQSWDGDPASVPAGAEPVPVTVDVVTPDINARLESASGR